VAQFDVHKNPDSSTNRAIPFLLDVQADLLENLATRVVIPLYSVSVFGSPAKHLNPKFTIKRKVVVMSTAELADVPVTVLGEKIVNLKQEREAIIAALNFLFTGIREIQVRGKR
jgi:toxin CcdB